MTAKEHLDQLSLIVNNYETEITSLKVEIEILKKNQLPTGVVNITITGIDKSQVVFT